MPPEPRVLRIYVTQNGKRPFEEWVHALKDVEAQGRILARLERVRLGLLGDCFAAGARRGSGGISQTPKCSGKITRAGKMPRSVPYDDYLIESLKNQWRAKAYLNAALEDGDTRVFLLALRNVAKARGFSKLATKSALNRESLYKMLSKRGNPSLRSLGSLLDSLGFRLAVSSKDAA